MRDGRDPLEHVLPPENRLSWGKGQNWLKASEEGFCDGPLGGPASDDRIDDQHPSDEASSQEDQVTPCLCEAPGLYLPRMMYLGFSSS